MMIKNSLKLISIWLENTNFGYVVDDQGWVPSELCMVWLRLVGDLVMFQSGSPGLVNSVWGYVATWSCDSTSLTGVVIHVAITLQQGYNTRFWANGKSRQKRKAYAHTHRAEEVGKKASG